jgi:hypothetical protein
MSSGKWLRISGYSRVGILVSATDPIVKRTLPLIPNTLNSANFYAEKLLRRSSMKKDVTIRLLSRPDV